MTEEAQAPNTEALATTTPQQEALAPSFNGNLLSGENNFKVEVTHETPQEHTARIARERETHSAQIARDSESHSAKIAREARESKSKVIKENAILVLAGFIVLAVTAVSLVIIVSGTYSEKTQEWATNAITWVLIAFGGFMVGNKLTNKKED